MTLKEKYAMMRSLGKDVVIYCDMDGVLAKWEEGCTYEKTWSPHYFLYLELEPSVKEALMLLQEAGFSCKALSAAYEEGTAREDKDNWLNNEGMESLPRQFVPCGKNKADFIDVEKGMTYILLDDFNPNVIAWEETEKDGARFVAVKFLNGINGDSGKWRGRTIHYHSSGEVIAHTLADLAVMA